MRKKLLLLVFLLPGLAAAYMAWITWRAQDDGKWIFTAFALVFLVPFVAGLFPRKPKPEPEYTGTRFVPHWFMMIAALLLVVVVLIAVVAGLVRLFRG